MMERTGHRSVTGVRNYKCTSEFHIEHCSATLDSKVIRKTGIQDKAQPSENHGPIVKFNFANSTVTINII